MNENENAVDDRSELRQILKTNGPRVAAIAGTLFQHEGVEAISMRRLAKEAGVTPKTLYAYFADKRDILQHVWAKFFVELFDQIDQIATSNKGPRARLRAACLHYLAYWIDQPEAVPHGIHVRRCLTVRCQYFSRCEPDY